MRRLFFALLIGTLIICMGGAAPAADPKQVLEDMTGALDEARAAQGEAEQWAGRRDALVEEEHELHRYVLWLDHQRAKYAAYIRERERAIAALERRKRESMRINMLLEPYLDDLAARLDTAVAADLPFLAEERAKRMAGVRRTLNDFEAPLGEKLRRVMEALLVEVRYGSETTADDAVIPGPDGADVQGRLLRVGRLGQYFLSRDGKRGFARVPGGGEWRELDDAGTKSVRAALDMTDRSRPAGLVLLPAGGAR